jgi:hypothetical protein
MTNFLYVALNRVKCSFSGVLKTLTLEKRSNSRKRNLILMQDVHRFQVNCYKSEDHLQRLFL